MANSTKGNFLRIVAKLVIELVMLLLLELRFKSSLQKIEENIKTVMKGVALLVLGAMLLFIALAALIAAVIIALLVVLPTWLAVLVGALGFTSFGAAFLLGGLRHFKGFTLVPAGLGRPSGGTKT